MGSIRKKSGSERSEHGIRKDMNRSFGRGLREGPEGIIIIIRCLSRLNGMFIDSSLGTGMEIEGKLRIKKRNRLNALNGHMQRRDAFRKGKA